MTKRKAPAPVAIGPPPENPASEDSVEALLEQLRALPRTPSREPEYAPKPNPTLESLVDELRAMNVDPGWVLYAALKGENIARGKGPIDALKADPRALYAPSVLEVLVRAALECRMPTFGGKADAEGLLTDVSVSPTRKAQAVILAASSALRSKHPAIDGAHRLKAATKALRLARQVETEADRIAEARALEVQPILLALRRVAKAHGMTESALKKRIERARKAFPGDVWPKKKARRL